MEVVKCLICLENCFPKQPCVNLKKYDKKETNISIKNQLQVTFLLRKILEIPESVCCQFLQDFGDPTLWIDCCDSCSLEVEEVKSVFRKIMLLEEKYKKLQARIRNAMIASVKLEEKVNKDCKQRPRELIRTYVHQALGHITIQPLEEIKSATSDAHSLVSMSTEKDKSVIESDGDGGHVNQNTSMYEEETAEENDPLKFLQIDYKDEDNNHNVSFMEENVEIPNPVEDNLLTPPTSSSHCNTGVGEIIEGKKESSLDSHLKPHNCDTCNKKFKTRTKLKIHQRIHTGEKPYTCSVCGKDFRERSKLMNHSRIHTGEKPYECEFCQTRFTSHTSYTQHLKLHTGERPYSCDICGKKFVAKSHLTTHYRVHTGEKPCQCNLCQQRFSCKSSLRKHLLRVHKTILPKTS